KRILKASLAYLFACLLSFTPFFLPFVGMSGHLAATSAVFFNPAKTLGRMVDAVTAGLCAITFGVLVSVASMLSAIWFNSRDLYIWGHVVSVVVFGGGSTFIIAYAKAHFNRPTINGALSLGDFNMTRVLALLTKTFLLESDTTPFGSESVQKLIEAQVKSFSALAKSLEEAQLEFPGSDIKKYEACVKSLNTLAQYLNGLRSSCGLQYDMLKRDEHLKDPLPKPQSSTTADQEQSASADLIEFLEHVGKPMKSLALTCKLTIEHLQDIFTSTDGDKKAALGRSNSRSRASQSHTVRQSGYENMHNQQDALAEKAPVGEQIFLVYFFVFNLMEFSKELSHLVSCVEELVDGDDGLPMWIERNRQPCSSQGTHGRQRKQRLFPKPNLHNKTDTLHTPRPSTFLQKWSTRLWKFLHVFRSFQVKYAAKTAFSTMVLLIPAFVDWTRPYFVQYRGEWALISMLIVMVPTVGGTNIVGIYRIMGTIVGCYAGVAIYLLFPANDILLPACCFLFAVPNFYLVLCSAYPRIGQVTLLAFNLVLIQTPNDPHHIDYVWTIALHRAVAVSLGVVIGVGVTSYIWPYEARVELRKGLSDLLLNISWLYNRLVSVYSTNLDKVNLPEDPTESDMDRMNKEFMAIELSLQLQLLRLYALLEETPNEPRLKGKFPVRTYKNMLGSCQNILDRFLSMRLVITKDEWIESARRDFIVPVNRERREMVGNVLLYFYTIASALRLKTPLPPYLPPANNARLRLIQKIRQLPVVQNKVVMAEDSDERYVFYYAYALVMDDVIRELERLGRWSQDLFGVITPAVEFEAWF
ncbi:MAG: Fusaric acid resistance protein-like-domain-containing protein, partial [Linnemannia elongata]